MYENCPSKTPKEGRSLRFREMVSEGSLQVLGGIKSLVPGLGPLCPPLREAFGTHTLHQGKSWEGSLRRAPPPGAADRELGACTVCSYGPTQRK